MSKKDKEKKGLLKGIVSKKVKENQVPVLFLGKNGVAEEMIVTPKDNMYNIRNQQFHERHGCDWELKSSGNKKKIKIIPEWGMYPLGNGEYLDALKSEEAEVQYDIIRAVQTAETLRFLEEKKKGKINPKVAVLVIIAIVVVLYFVMGG